MVRAFVRLGLVIVVVLLLQLSLISEMHLFTATGDILLLLAISAGIAAGPEWGALTGFIAGIAFDLVLQTPFGLSALSYCMPITGIPLPLLSYGGSSTMAFLVLIGLVQSVHMHRFV